MALCTWAHPRSREEHSSTARISKPPPGSSPLARGTRHSRTTARVSPGLIPARAGNTNPASARKGHGGAHPRSRGEHATPGALEAAARGSSPLARGTRWCVARQAAHRGLIPARAGNTLMLHESAINIWAHPRSRGEHGLVEQLQGVRLGSSPLARGTRQSGAGKLTRRGLIPARAGNTCFRLSVRLASRAHPRSRGEHLKIWSGPPVVRGSSPLARGTHVLVHEGRGRVGLIPARAGNMEEPPPTPPVKWAHPRSRGEHRSHQNRGCRPTGSSPLARGTPFCPVLGEVFPGLIPARAGNTWLLARVLAACRAHPRSRGEHRGLTS